jgi:MerR family transcriptional regulator, light-induced transcriptional regulator
MILKAGGKNLTSKETARILGVSEASVKRWADGGLLPVTKTAGGHRRFQPEDIVVFQRSEFGAAKQANTETQPGVSKTKTLHAVDDAALIDKMFETLLEGRPEEVSALLINLSLQGQSVALIADFVLCPALRKIGEYWQKGNLSVAEEHVASRAGIAALQRLRSIQSLSSVRGMRMICSSTENDFHEFPTQVAALTLESKGWEVINLGASTPFYALEEAVERFKPRLVAVASTILGDLDRAAREYKDFRRTAVRLNASVVLGGAGFSGEIRQRFEADLYADGFCQLEEFAAGLTV